MNDAIHETMTEVPIETVRSDAVQIWPFDKAPEALREGAPVNKLLVYVPVGLREFPWRATFEPCEIREQGDGAWIITCGFPAKTFGV